VVGLNLADIVRMMQSSLFQMMFYALCGSAALNDLGNLHAHHMGLGASVCRVNAPLPDYGKPQDFGLYSLQTPAIDNRCEEVGITTIDSLDLARLDFLKIDVEGMELEVLRGAEHAIQDFGPWCWVEYWKVGVDAIKAGFSSGSYRFFAMDRLNLLCAPVARMASSGISINASEL
jgi:FkbM family methyltransferase